MKKNFRKTPPIILQKIQEINDDFIIGTVINLSENDFNNLLYSDIDLKIVNGQIEFNQEFVPSSTKGRYSKKNVEGYRIKYPDRPKVSKTYYAGERPIYGDYTKGTFSLFITKMVTAYDNIPPREISLIVEILETNIQNDQNHYIFKIATNQVLNQNIDNFDDELLFNLNLLQENIGSVNVFSSETTREEYLDTLEVNWEIFPPGERDEDLERITQNLRNLTPQRIEEINDRYNFLHNENPNRIIIGRSGMLRYFGAKFSENLVVFENTRYGNAIYILFENWRELSRLSRLEIQNRPSDQYIRIPHSRNWKGTVRAIIRARR
jgi:hypothetical protein